MFNPSAWVRQTFFRSNALVSNDLLAAELLRLQIVFFGWALSDLTLTRSRSKSSVTQGMSLAPIACPERR